MRRYFEIERQEASEKGVEVGDFTLNLSPIPRPNWKPVSNPRRTDRFLQGLNAKGELVTPHNLKLQCKKRSIRRNAAARRKHLRQNGELPYMQ